MASVGLVWVSTMMRIPPEEAARCVLEAASGKRLHVGRLSRYDWSTATGLNEKDVEVLVTHLCDLHPPQEESDVKWREELWRGQRMQVVMGLLALGKVGFQFELKLLQTASYAVDGSLPAVSKHHAWVPYAVRRRFACEEVAKRSDLTVEEAEALWELGGGVQRALAANPRVPAALVPKILASEPEVRLQFLRCGSLQATWRHVRTHVLRLVEAEGKVAEAAQEVGAILANPSVRVDNKVAVYRAFETNLGGPAAVAKLQEAQEGAFKEILAWRHGPQGPALVHAGGLDRHGFVVVAAS